MQRSKRIVIPPLRRRAITSTPALTSIGIDIGKDVIHVVGFGADAKIAFRRKIKRLGLARRR